MSKSLGNVSVLIYSYSDQQIIYQMFLVFNLYITRLFAIFAHYYLN